MAKKKKLSKTDIRKRNLLQQVRRMEKNRYRFTTDIREEIKHLSPQKARYFTPQKLYEKAVFYTTEGDVIPGVERRKQERSEAAKKAAETRKRKQIEKELLEEFEGTGEEPQEEKKDITEEILRRMYKLIDFLDSEPADTIITKRGKEVEKPPEIYVYGKSVKNNLRSIFNYEASRNKVALAMRLYENADIIDQLIGTIEYSGYLEDIRVASNELIAILRGTSNLSKEDRAVSEQIANSLSELEESLL